MMKDRDDVYGGTPIERAMLNKIGNVPDNFRVYCAGWIGKTPKDWKTMSITGGLFEQIKRGKRAGRMIKLIPGTKQTVIVTVEELQAAKTELAT